MIKITEYEHIDPGIGYNPNYIGSIKHASPLHCHDYYEFFLITRGRCLHRVNGETQRLAQGALVFIRPDDGHCYDYDGETDCGFINLACSRQVMEAALEYLGAGGLLNNLLESLLPPVTQLSKSGMDDFIEDFERLKALATIDKKLAGIQLRRFLADSLSRYAQSVQTNVNGGIPLWFESLLTRMQRKENFVAGLDRLMELSSRSVGHVNRVFREYAGTTPTAYINSLRLDYAKSLLLITNLSITDTALEAGFENLSHFYHLFRQRFGTTPSDLRSKRC